MNARSGALAAILGHRTFGRWHCGGRRLLGDLEYGDRYTSVGRGHMLIAQALILYSLTGAVYK